MGARPLPPWYYHVAWPLDLHGPELHVAGRAQLLVAFQPVSAALARQDLDVAVTGTLELPPLTALGESVPCAGQCYLRWRPTGLALEMEVQAAHAGRRFELRVAVPPPAGPPRAAEPARLNLLVDGQPCAEGTLELFVRRFALRALGAADDLPAAAQATPLPWPIRLEKWLRGPG